MKRAPNDIWFGRDEGGRGVGKLTCRCGPSSTPVSTVSDL